MGRTIIGSLLVGWSFVLIPANLGLPGYEADLIFGFFLLVFGSILAYSGARKIRATGRASESSHEEPGTTPPSTSKESSMQRIMEGTIIGVLGGVISGVIMKMLGG
jgi:hypothetical protein